MKQKITTKQNIANKTEDEITLRKEKLKETEDREQNKIADFEAQKELLNSETSILTKINQYFNEICEIITEENLKKIQIEIQVIKEESEKSQIVYQKYKEDLQKLSDQIPIWEEIKSRSIEAKNYAIAGKMTNQIKGANEIIRTITRKLKELETSYNGLDGLMDDYKNKIKEKEKKIKVEKMNKEINIKKLLEEIVQIVIEQKTKSEITKEKNTLIRTLNNMDNILYESFKKYLYLYNIIERDGSNEVSDVCLSEEVK